ncbi:MAG: aminopeptidase, partial [Ktedonobacteraceae bacterium]|nr:aminopeptidase [Ktedonobacteraceae bacterium]
TSPLAAPLVEAVYGEALRAGAHPIPIIGLDHLDEILLKEGSDEQLSWISPVSQMLAERATAQLTINTASNTRALSNIDPARLAIRQRAARAFMQTRRQREQAGEFRWCLTLYPTSALAQDASMSLREFEEFVLATCFLNDADPIARWKELSVQQQRLVDWLAGHEKVRVIGEDTDLTLSIKDRIFINSDGKRNFPSGEFFTSPVEDSANGKIRFSVPSSLNGRGVEDIRLVFREGKVVEASAGQGEDYLLRMLDLDQGARFLGEFAFGNNPGITRGTRNILFDEKMGGTVHLALGASYPETGGRNQSALHWDMVCDLRQSGEVWVDDTLFLKDGKILV